MTIKYVSDYEAILYPEGKPEFTLTRDSGNIKEFVEWFFSITTLDIETYIECIGNDLEDTAVISLEKVG